MRFLPLAAALALAAGCGGSSGRAGSPDEGGGTSATDEPLENPKGPLDLADARRWVLTLVNRSRAEHDLPAVTWDEVAAEAGQRHAEDMAKRGFTAHIGSDGSVPELRYTEAGGDGLVMENAGCFADAMDRELDPSARYLPEALKKIHDTFMDEVPPNDGHRRNILTKVHTSFGVGLAQPKGLAIPCMAQEFVDDYGEYGELPAKAKVGQKVKVTGSVRAPMVFGGVGVARIDAPKPRTAKELLKTGGYSIPAPTKEHLYFPKGFKTPIPVEVNGDAFSIELPLSVGGRPGIYEVSVWGKVPPSKELSIISLRTIRVD